MIYPGNGVVFSHFPTRSTSVNIKGFGFDMSTAPTASRTLTGAASTDKVLFAIGAKWFSAAGAQPKLSMPTIAYSLGTGIVKFSNAMSNMAVWGAWIDENA
jgi:hypothetical protein